MPMKTPPFWIRFVGLLSLSVVAALTHAAGAEGSERTRDYTLIVSGFDWGPAANKVVLPLGASASEAHASQFQVTVKRSSSLSDLAPERRAGLRNVVMGYVSDSEGNRSESGQYFTLVLSVGPDDALASPMEYIAHRNHWIDYQLTVMDRTTERVWDRETRRIRPVVDAFNLDGVYEHDNGQRLTYAYFEPPLHSEKSHPLIIWLHGGGEGGTDPSIPLMANLASNYATPGIQLYFEGAYVLVPQTPTFWMQAQDGEYTRGDREDIQHEALMGLIRQFVMTHAQVDVNRIYVGGCSNGGYMSLKLVLEHPDFFAAAFPVALGYHAEFLSDAQIERIQSVPMWLVHSADDETLSVHETALPLYKRLLAAGAKSVHFSLYERVVDIRGFFGGDDYWYNGHFSWIYCHANHCRFDYDGSPVKIEGRPVSIMEWLAAQWR